MSAPLFRDATKEEFGLFLAEYPRPLVRDVSAISEPPLVTYNDFQRAPKWPDSIVASHALDGGYDPNKGPHGWRVLADINSPVPDDGKRDTDRPLFDSYGAQLHEGDEVEAGWGSGPPNTVFYGRIYDNDGNCVVREKILIRDKGTKYERWSFESCHNYVRGFTMRKVAT